MRFASRQSQGAEPDMTPMIDIVFQLLAFFMFTINLSSTETDQRVTLPSSELAKPPDAPYDHPLTIHLTEQGEYIYAGAALANLNELRSALLREKQIIERYAVEKLEDVTIVIRADEDANSSLNASPSAASKANFAKLATIRRLATKAQRHKNTKK
jgi:biopolymer transport protein ExbD